MYQAFPWSKEKATNGISAFFPREKLNGARAKTQIGRNPVLRSFKSHPPHVTAGLYRDPIISTFFESRKIKKCITTINIFINGFDKIIIWHPFLLDQMRIKWVYRPERSSLFLLNDSSGKLDLTRSGNEQLIKLLDYTPRGDFESFHTYSEVYYHEEIGLGWFHFTLKNPVASIMESFAQSLSSDPLWWHLNRFNDQFITD